MAQRVKVLATEAYILSSRPGVPLKVEGGRELE